MTRIAAIRTNNSIHGKTDIRFSTALMDYAGKIPEHPEGHHMYVKSLHVVEQTFTGNSSDVIFWFPDV